MEGWAEALERLASERALAESGAGLLKRCAADAAGRSRGENLYGKARAAAEGLR